MSFIHFRPFSLHNTQQHNTYTCELLVGSSPTPNSSRRSQNVWKRCSLRRPRKLTRSRSDPLLRSPGARCRGTEDCWSWGSITGYCLCSSLDCDARHRALSRCYTCPRPSRMALTSTGRCPLRRADPNAFQVRQGQQGELRAQLPSRTPLPYHRSITSPSSIRMHSHRRFRPQKSAVSTQSRLSYDVAAMTLITPFFFPPNSSLSL